MKKKERDNKSPFRWTHADVTLDVLNDCAEALGFNPLDHASIVQTPQPDPLLHSPESFREAYWRAEIWSKYPFEIGVDRELAALAAFFEYEERCAETNKRLCDAFARPIPERYRAMLMHAQSLMSDLFRGFSLDEVIRHCTWGPGATTSMPRLKATPQNKWVEAAHMTGPVRPYLQAFEWWSGFSYCDPVIVEGNKVITVPKNAKTERTIAIEPDWNMFFQLGFGGAIRRRLQRKFGLLRNDAQEVNQALARRGSVDGVLATVDLKGASDMLSLALVELLVPSDVYQHLVALRSPIGVLPDGRKVVYEKISSMGNGYTFELETAIFYCLVRACSGYARTFGDDIVVIASAVPLLKEFLEFCGMILNEKKTHYSGPFRESCGGHFHSGVNVTPPYVRKPLTGPRRLDFCNRVSELCDNGYWRDGLLKKAWDTCKQGVPKFLYGPPGVAGTLHVSLDEGVPQRSKRYQTWKGTMVIESRAMGLSTPVGAMFQSLWADPKEVAWRRSQIELKDNRPVLSYGTWYSGWADASPWSTG